VTCATKTSLGAYVLGALDERERDRVDEHVASCSRCREELEALIPVRAYLARLAPEELEGAEAPALLERPVEAPKLPVRRRVLAADARASVVDARTGVRASVAAASRPWGTELRVRMSGATPGERCRLIARARDGRSDVAATWWTTYGGSAEVTGAAAIPAADLVALDVVTATGRRLVHVPMNQAGGTT
jgi:anti-sigma factor RsiW